ncbi:unnamed protein product [Staurois parvus]|uniref:Uncharacterized protein n=1 Tax=Staurois parvus TaxID=386267 RepID=A0ABN9DN44_9NEOB|nr:unnamed protein product [Staurois parvus]
MCHFQVSSHCWWVPFCHRVCCKASHLLLPPPPQTVAPHSLVYGPGDCPNE